MTFLPWFNEQSLNVTSCSATYFAAGLVGGETCWKERHFAQGFEYRRVSTTDSAHHWVWEPNIIVFTTTICGEQGLGGEGPWRVAQYLQHEGTRGERGKRATWAGGQIDDVAT